MPSGAIITTLGLAKLASATPLNQLNISALAVGDGNGGYPTLDPSMTALTNEVWRGTPSPPIRDPNSPNVLIFEAVIPPSVGGFTVREQAIFDDAGDMIAIGQTSVVEKPLPNAATGVILTVRLHIQLDNAGQVDLFFQDDPTISADNVSNANGGSVQDFIDAQHTTVAELATGKFQVGQYVILTDRAGAKFNVVAGGTADGFAVIDAGNGNTAITESINVEALGAVEGGDIAPHLNYLHGKDKGADVFLSTATLASTADFSNKHIRFKPKGLSPFGKTVLTVAGNFPAFKWAGTGFPSGGSISGCYIDYGDGAPTDEPTQGQRLAIDYGDADIGPATWGAGHKLSDMYIRGAWIGCKDRTGAFLIEWERVIWQKCRKPFIKENGTTLKLSSCYAFECHQGFTAKNFITLTMVNHACDSADSNLSDFGYINLVSGLQNFNIQLHAEINEIRSSNHRLLYIENSTGTYSLAGLHNKMYVPNTYLVEVAQNSSVVVATVDEFKLVQSESAQNGVMGHIVATTGAKAKILSGRGSAPTVSAGAVAPFWYHYDGNVTLGHAFNALSGSSSLNQFELTELGRGGLTLGTFSVPTGVWSLIGQIPVSNVVSGDFVKVSSSPAISNVILYGTVNSDGFVNVYAYPITGSGSISGQTINALVVR